MARQAKSGSGELGRLGGWWDEPLRWGIPLPSIGGRRLHLHMLLLLFAVWEVMRALHVAGFSDDDRVGFDAFATASGAGQRTADGPPPDTAAAASLLDRVMSSLREMLATVDVQLVLLGLGSLVIGLVLHEIGHGFGRGMVRWAAWMQDDARRQGPGSHDVGTGRPSPRLSTGALFPGRRQDLIRRRLRRRRLSTTVLWPLGNLAQAWLPRAPRGNAALLPPAAGPIASAIVCLVLTPILLSATGSTSIVFFPPFQPAEAFAEWTATHPDARPETWLVILWWINHVSLFLVLVNLIPMYPLDAARFIEAALAGRRGLRRAIEVMSIVGYATAGLIFVIGMAINDPRVLVLAVVGGVLSWHLRRSMEAAIGELGRLVTDHDRAEGGSAAGDEGVATSRLAGRGRGAGRVEGGTGAATASSSRPAVGGRTAIARSDSGDQLTLSAVRRRDPRSGRGAADPGRSDGSRHAGALAGSVVDPRASGDDDDLFAMDPAQLTRSTRTTRSRRRLGATAEALLDDLIEDLVGTRGDVAATSGRTWEDDLMTLLSGRPSPGPGPGGTGERGGARSPEDPRRAAGQGAGRVAPPGTSDGSAPPMGGDVTGDSLRLPVSGVPTEPTSAAGAQAQASTGPGDGGNPGIPSVGGLGADTAADRPATSADSAGGREGPPAAAPGVTGPSSDRLPRGPDSPVSGNDGPGAPVSGTGNTAGDGASSTHDGSGDAAGPRGGRTVERQRAHPRLSEEEELDLILEKISRHGLKSLSTDERAVLHRATARRRGR